MRYYEDLIIGVSERFGQYDVTRAEVLEFAGKYDPQPFHLSDEEAAKTHFGRLPASGWHTCGMMMAMYVAHMKEVQLASLGGLGMDELRWPKPVYPGDTLHCESELLSKRRSGSRPEMGVTRSKMTVLNQHDAIVMTMIANGMVATRDPKGSD